MSGFYANDPYAGPVAFFMRAAGQGTGVALDRDTPSDLIDLRLRLMNEELDEVWDAINRRDYISLAQELADLLYVVFGTAVAFGVPIQEVFAAVSAANLSKLDENTGKPLEMVDGKVLKGPNYIPAEPAIKFLMMTKLVGEI